MQRFLLRVFFVDIGGVAQHDRGKVDGRLVREHLAAEAAPAEQGEPAGMIDVRMRENDGVDFGGIERERSRVGTLVLQAALEHAAIDEHAASRDFQQMQGTGDLASSTMKNKLHPNSVPNAGSKPSYPRVAQESRRERRDLRFSLIGRKATRIPAIPNALHQASIWYYPRDVVSRALGPPRVSHQLAFFCPRPPHPGFSAHRGGVFMT